MALAWLICFNPSTLGGAIGMVMGMFNHPSLEHCVYQHFDETVIPQGYTWSPVLIISGLDKRSPANQSQDLGPAVSDFATAGWVSPLPHTKKGGSETFKEGFL